jgi:hypothetical protein
MFHFEHPSPINTVSAPGAHAIQHLWPIVPHAAYSWIAAIRQDMFSE